MAWRAGVVAVTATSTACVLFDGFGDLSGGEPADASFDASLADTSMASDEAAASDGGDAADADMETYSALDDPTEWSFFNAGVASFEGAAFDGRFVYFGCQGSGKVLRYDTSQVFTAPVAWSVFNTTSLTGLTQEAFSGATFDGTYVYFVPRVANAADGGNLTFSGEVVRFDTRQPGAFEADAGTGAWSVFDTTTLPQDDGNPVGSFGQATFDGHYVYFIPTGGPLADGGFLRDGLVARFDPTGDASLTSPAHWSVFDTATTNPAAVGFLGGVFDGRFLYAVPFRTAGNLANGLAVRFDVTAPFQDAAAWSSFNLAANVNPSAATFQTGAFDGRYVYFAPSSGTLATRFDTQSGFASAASWSTYDLVNVISASAGDAGIVTNAAHFADIAFDGRYLYFSSNFIGDPIVVRYDTQAAFDDAAGWTSINVKTANLDSTLNANVSDFGSAVFDGQYLYLAPATGSIIARFKAKSPPAQPKLPAYYGSTF